MRYIITTVVSAVLLQGCFPLYQTTADPAEQYIKTNIESHSTNEFSNIRIYSIYSITSTGTRADIRFTGYKYNHSKGLVLSISTFTSSVSGGKTVYHYDSTRFIELDTKQCQAIVDNYQTLISRLKQEKPITSEYVYHDYTVNSDLFISYRGTTYYTKTMPEPVQIDCWIGGQKFSMQTADVIRKIQEFLNY